MSHTTEVVAILPCTHSVYRHTCEETQGIWMMRITGESAFYCRHHAIDIITMRLVDGLDVTKLTHLDVDLLLSISLELFTYGAEAYQETSEYDRDEDFRTYVGKIGKIRRAVETLIDAKSTQLTLI